MVGQLEPMTLKDKAIQTALTGNWQEAILTNKELIKENSKDIDALNRLALAYTIVGKIKSAKMTYQKVLDIDPLNPIALRNLKNLKGSNKSIKIDSSSAPTLNNQFIEETGKTKILDLVNIAPASVIQGLRTGESVTLSIKRLKIFVLKNEKQYIGVLPDDVGKRLIKFIKAGNKYEAYIKSTNSHKVIIFIKELKRASKFKNQPSFLMMTESVLFDKEKLKNAKANLQELEEEDYSEEEEPDL